MTLTMPEGVQTARRVYRVLFAALAVLSAWLANR